MAEFHDRLKALDACREAREWAASYATAQSGWDACKRGDWMLWLCGRLAGGPGSDARLPLVLAACECARLALVRVPDGDNRPRLAIEAAEDWARGGATTMDQVRKAAHAAAASAHVAAATAAAAAHVAAATAAAADAAYTAYAAAAAYVADVARVATLKTCAAIVRKHYPVCPLEVADAEVHAAEGGAQVSKHKTPLELAASFVREVDALNSLPFMMASYDHGKYAICKALIAAEKQIEDLQFELSCLDDAIAGDEEDDNG